MSTFIFNPIRYISFGVTEGEGNIFGLKVQPPSSSKGPCQVKEAVMHGADEIAGGLHLPKIDGQP